MEIINNLIRIWINLCIFSVILLFLRSDFAQIRKDILRSIRNNMIGATITIAWSLILLPIIIPFSLKNIANKIIKTW